MPCEDVGEGARALNQRHLVAQLGEGSIVLRALMEPCDGAGWRHHPAVRMWRGYEQALLEYLFVHVWEADRRDYHTLNFRLRFDDAASRLADPLVWPWWWGGEIHLRERQALVARFAEHYGQIWPDVQPIDGYWTPVPHVEGDHACRTAPSSS